MESAGNSSDHRWDTGLSNYTEDVNCCSPGMLTHSAFCKPISVFWSQLPELFAALFLWFTCLFVWAGNLFTDFVVCNLQNFPEGYRKIIMYLRSEVIIKNWFLLHFAFCQVQPNSKYKFHVQSCGYLYFSHNVIQSFQPELHKIKRQFFSEQLFPEGVKDLGYHQLLSINSQPPHKFAIWIWLVMI